jgi:hypothetical protein
VPFYKKYYGQNPLLQGEIICNERLGGPLKSCFKARMRFLIVLRTLMLMIPTGILKNVEFYDGFLPVFRTQDQDLHYMSLKRCTNNIQVGYAYSCVKRCQNGVSRHL